jgi:Spy/CpxP family protein refolding chaperone
MRTRMLVVLACAALCAVRWAPAPPAAAQGIDGHGPRPSGPPRPFFDSPEEKERVRLRIGITKEQQAQIEAAHQELDQKRRELGARLWEQYRKLGAVYTAYDFDRQQAKAIRREIFSLHRQILDLHAENEERLRKILSKEQFERFQAVMKETFERLRNDRASRRGGPSGPGRP